MKRKRAEKESKREERGKKQKQETEALYKTTKQGTSPLPPNKISLVRS